MSISSMLGFFLVCWASSSLCNYVDTFLQRFLTCMSTYCNSMIINQPFL